jgi:hypothetical protein
MKKLFVLVSILIISFTACKKDDPIPPGSQVVANLALSYESEKVTLTQVTITLKLGNFVLDSQNKTFNARPSQHQFKFNLDPSQLDDLIGQELSLEVVVKYKSAQNNLELTETKALVLKEKDNQVSFSFLLTEVPVYQVKLKVIVNLEYNNYPSLNWSSPIGIGLYPRSGHDPNGPGQRYALHNSPDNSYPYSPSQYSYQFNFEGASAQALLGKTIWIFIIVSFQRGQQNFTTRNSEKSLSVINGYQEIVFNISGP